MSEKPPLLATSHVVCLSAGYALSDNGGGVVTRNLLGLFAPQSYSMGVMNYGSSPPENRLSNGTQTIDLFSARTKKGRLNEYLFDMEMPLARRKLKKLIRETRAQCLVVVYPTFHFLQLARDVAKELQIPWLAYWHDTVYESLSETKFAKRSQILQQQTFDEASSLLVMSEGMVDFYRDHYNQPTVALEHCYPEPIATDLADVATTVAVKEALWGGSIYSINNRSLARVSQSLSQAEVPLLITSRASREQLLHQGIEGAHIRQNLFTSREEYLEAVLQRQMLLLALNWPEETTILEGEMATIFPTKTIEYLAAGRPILLHCPEHYFLARFFRQHQCGLVVSERSPAALNAAVQKILAGGPEIEAMRANALQAAQLFSSQRVGGIFARHVGAVANAKWGEKIQL